MNSNTSIIAVLLCIAVSLPAATAQDASGDAQSSSENASLRGKVVWMAEAMQRLYGSKSVPEAEERVIALESPDGQLVPILEDIRGRSFRSDKRLRGIDVELFVRQFDGSPMVQVIKIFSIKKDGVYEVDYWCEICAIPMYELKPCDCCQGPIELRERKVETPPPDANQQPAAD